MEIINAPWLGELHKLVKDRIDAVEDALKRAQEKHKNTVVATENGYEWTNHMGIKKQYSASGVAAMKEFVRMYEAGRTKSHVRCGQKWLWPSILATAMTFLLVLSSLMSATTFSL